jgi:malate synthase
MTVRSSSIVVSAGGPPDSDVLTPDALAFLARLQRQFGEVRHHVLARRDERRRSLAGHPVGAPLDFPADTASVRAAAWQVAPAPPDLDDRRVEITGPVDRKMMINALNSGARVFMADLEDACSPTWANVMQGQRNLIDAVRRTIALESAGKSYRL